MSLYGYRSITRIGNLERAKRVVGYLAKIGHVVIKLRTGLPDYSDITHIKYDWEHSMYGNVKEEFPKNDP